MHMTGAYMHQRISRPGRPLIQWNHQHRQSPSLLCTASSSDVAAGRPLGPLLSTLTGRVPIDIRVEIRHLTHVW